MARKPTKPLIQIPQNSLTMRLFSGILEGLLKIVVVIVLLAILGGILKSVDDLRLFLNHDLEEATRQILINVIYILAAVEILLTAFSYIKEGQVKVHFIIDTVLIIMLNEVVILWFKGKETQLYIPLLATIGLLSLIRGVFLKSPEKQEKIS